MIGAWLVLACSLGGDGGDANESSEEVEDSEATADSLSCPTASPCTRSLDDGEYVVQTALGEAPGSGWPVVVFFHGYRGSPDKWVQDEDEATSFAEGGFVWLLPVSAGNSWSMGGDRGDRDDRAFVESALDDLARELPLDRDRVYISGQSSGGAMVHEMACLDGAAYAAYGPMSGVFFTPLPEPGTCAGPAPMRHRHGADDSTWPLEGRDLGSVSQGDVAEVMQAWATEYDCQTQAVDTGDEGTCEQWSDCTGGVTVTWCLDDGGHSPPTGWAADLVAFFSR